MPSQHGQVATFQTQKVIPTIVRLPGAAGVQYVTTIGGIVVPVMLPISFGLQSNPALAANDFLILAVGLANTVTVITKVFAHVAVAGNFGLANDAVQDALYFLATTPENVIDFGPYGTTGYAIGAGNQFRLYNRTGGAVGIDAVAFGYQAPYQT